MRSRRETLSDCNFATRSWCGTFPLKSNTEEQKNTCNASPSDAVLMSIGLQCGKRHAFRGLMQEFDEYALIMERLANLPFSKASFEWRTTAHLGGESLGEQDTGAEGRGQKAFFGLGWRRRGTGVARACPVPPGLSLESRRRRRREN
eukprot:gene6822-biopygen13491